MIEHNIILLISNRANSSHSVLAGLGETDYEVVRANSPSEGVALLYVMHSVAAVVLDNQVRELASFDVAQSLREIRPNVPVMLLRGDRIDRSPSWIDSCASTDKHACGLQHFPTAVPVIR
jgi:DNA-binding response OmpR family regulator